MKKLKEHSLAVYFILLIIFCALFVLGARMLGEKGAYMAQGYMLTPAIAAIIMRLFFYPLRFKDANLQFGKLKDYFRFWVFSVVLVVIYYFFFSLFGAVSWDLSGQIFLNRLTEQLASGGQNIDDTLPPGFTPRMMLILFFIGGLTFFNIVPGLITGFGEEFGHRGFMLPLLYKMMPRQWFIIGGLIWFAWHLPLVFLIPTTDDFPFWQDASNFLILGMGSICTFIYLSYVYVKSKSVFVTSIVHITMNNASAAFSYFVVLENQILANAGITLTMMILVLIMYFRKEFAVFNVYFKTDD